MKKLVSLAMMLTSMVVLATCNQDLTDDLGGYENILSDNGTITPASGDLLTFAVTIDKDSEEPSTSATPYYPETEDNLANNSFENVVSIDLSNPKEKTENGVTVTVNGGHITADHGSQKGICYVVSGSTTNGSFTVLGDKKYEVKLSNATIVNPDSAALNLLSSKRAFVILEGTNSLKDGSSSKNDHKGALYCKGKLLFCESSGTLEVYGNYNNAIHSADYIIVSTGNNIYAKSTKNHGIKANDGIFINGGILNVEVSAAAAKGINCEKSVIVNGGRTTVITTGVGTYEDGEAKAAAAIKTDSTFVLNDGIVRLKSTGSGGKGLKTDSVCTVNGGQLYIITTGSQYRSSNDTASPKGIKADKDLKVNGGTVMIRTGGYNGEGMESKKELTISGGTVIISAYDDAVNSSSNMYVKGGNIIVVGNNSDGLDTNGNMYISGGNIVAFGGGGAETGIDIGERYKLYITGGNIFGIGGRIDANLGSTSQGIATTTGSVTANGTVTVSSGTTTLATFTMPPYSYSSGTIMVSTPSMQSGNSYTLTAGGNSQSITASSSLSSSWGGGPGGRW